MKKLSILLLLQYFITVLLLIFLYKGGYRFQPEIHHFVWDKTYLSDLGRTHYFSGIKNPYWWLYTLTLSWVGIGTILFFWILSLNLSKFQSLMVRLLGFISGLGYIGIAINPVDIHFSAHIFWGSVAFFSFYFAWITIIIFTFKKNSFSRKIILLILFLILSVYLYLQLTLPKTTDEHILLIKVIAQKITVISLLVLSVLWLVMPDNENFKN